MADAAGLDLAGLMPAPLRVRGTGPSVAVSVPTYRLLKERDDCPGEEDPVDAALAATAAIGLGWVENAAPENRRWSLASPGEQAALTIRLVRECGGGSASRSGAAGAEPLLEDESYRLDLTGGSSLSLRVLTRAGLARGLATLAQLAAGGDAVLPAVEIDDRPRFGWRGLMLDVARHFFPVPIVCRQLDAMARFKLNVLHLHLTDDQGFRIECGAFPRLHEMGSGGQFYRRDEVRQIVAYAAARGIRVVPEFDLPGHASSWLAGYPEFGCDPERPVDRVRTWGCVDVCFDPSNEALYEFLDAFFADVLPLFPDRCVHLGGDEVLGDHWRATPHLAAQMAAEGWDTADLQARFQSRVARILHSHGKCAVGWDEVVHPAGPRDVIAQAWRGEEAVATARAAGHDAVRSHGYYLNALLPIANHYGVDPAGRVQGDSEQKTQPARPSSPERDLECGSSGRVLGGEACMWTEFVDEFNLDTRLWPRLAGIAERFWSPLEALRPRALAVPLDAASAQLRRAGLAVDGPLVAQWGSDLGLEPQRRDAVIPSQENDQATPLDALADRLPVESRRAARCAQLVRDRDERGLAVLWEKLAVRLAELERSPQDDERAMRQLSRAAGRIRKLVQLGRGLSALGRGGVTDRREEHLRRRLRRCATPWMGLSFALVPPLEELLERAVGVDPTVR